MSASDDALLSCSHCGLTLETPRHSAGSRRCPRCGSPLPALASGDLDASFAWALAAMILLGVANILPFLTLEIEGREEQTRLIGGVVEFFERGMVPLALLVGFVTIVAPAVMIALQLWLSWHGRRGRAPPGAVAAMRLHGFLRPWAMLEVFLLGALVAYVKLADLATVGVGLAAISFVLVVLMTVLSDRALEPARIWCMIQAQRAAASQGRAHDGLCCCEACGQVADPSANHGHCTRCGATVHRRKTRSLQRCWALLLASAVLLFPANLLPILTVISFGQGAPSTIMGGVIALADHGQWPLAALVFIASIAVPFAKIASLVYLLLTTHWRASGRLRARTKLYRFTEAIGRWSMIDIFVIAILVSLVQLGAIATIEPGPAAAAFGAAVVLTMLAAHEFDPRLMWDRAGANG